MPPPPRTILLDLDGTLVDSRPGILLSCRAALRALGHEPDADLDVTALIGPPMDDVMRHLLAPHGDARVAEAVAAYRRDYGERGLYASRAYPGIADALRALRGAGARLRVATSKRTAFAERILEHLGLDHHFDGIHGAEPGGALDGKPELIAHVVASHGLRAGRCRMVGDRRQDVAGAHANGMLAVGALWGYGGRDELEAAGADRLAATPEALPDALLRAADAPPG